jgi:DNA-binding IclR family transcriptional regulator
MNKSFHRTKSTNQLFDEKDRPISTLSVAGSTSRVKRERFEPEHPEQPKSAANVIELNLTYS